MEVSTSNKTLYDPLGEKEIRVARILPAEAGSDAVKVRLHLLTLGQGTPYEALSYCWGDPKVTRPICVNDDVVEVTTNLEAALRQLRDGAPNEEMDLWADAICINQSDLAERSSQVSIMFQIYEGAVKVHIWLGKLENRAMYGIDVLERLLEHQERRGHWSHFEFWDSESQRMDGIEALACLCRAPYWKRMWIVQEVSHKENDNRWDERLVLHLGNRALQLSTWMLAYDRHSWLAHGQEERKTSIRSTADGQTCMGRLRLLDQALADIGQAFLPMVIGTWGSRTKEALSSGDLTFARFLPTLIMELRKSQATDARDKIYGMLGLLPGSMNLTPDYEKSVRTVYCEATISIMNITRTLFITHQACSLNEGLPSWVPDYREPSRMPISFQCNFETFRADAVTSSSIQQADDDILRVGGLDVDTISDILHHDAMAETARLAGLQTGHEARRIKHHKRQIHSFCL